MNKTSISLIYSFFNKINNNMKNEIVRKLTSLTLMTIMFAGGLTIAFPGVMPSASAAHNANLFVSAENSFSNNIFSGPMVIEVVIVNSAISALDDAIGEPTVTINGDDLKMLQATDGNWYGYFASRAQAQEADETQPGLDGASDDSTAPGMGLNFGKFCSATSGAGVLGLSTAETEGFAIPGNATSAVESTTAGANGTDGTNPIGTCAGGSHSPTKFGDSFKQMNVVR